MSAVAVMSRIFMQKDRREPALGAVSLLVSDLPEWKTNRVDFYYWYNASLALFQYDGPEGPVWSKWNEPMKNAIVPHQKGRADGCRCGSWDPEEDAAGRGRAHRRIDIVDPSAVAPEIRANIQREGLLENSISEVTPS